MATPTTNSTFVDYFDPASTGAGRYLADGEKWGRGLGNGVTLTYSFPGASPNPSTPSKAANYGYGEYNGDYALSASEQSAAKAAMGAWAAVSGVRFVQVADNASTVGEIRFASTSYDTADEAAHAYLPSSAPEAGDVWLSRSNFNVGYSGAIEKGSFDYMTLLHELGHSLGLKHSFEGPSAIPEKYDNYFYTIMSYTASARSEEGDNYASFYPTTPMYYDLVAIQAIYGRNTAHNSGNSTYTFVDGRRYFETIDDAGGTDRIVYNGTDGVRINLNPGAASSVSEAVSFSSYLTRNTVFIGPNSFIERAQGGTGNDTLVGNARSNGLAGGAGNDTLNGKSGADTLSAGSGNDSLFGSLGNDRLYGGAGADSFYFNATLGANVDTIADFSARDDTLYLDNSVFGSLSLGHLKTAQFKLWTARDANDFIVYDKAHGFLYYDRDGSGAAAAIHFATVIPDTVLTQTDFIII